MRGFFKALVSDWNTNDNSGRIQIVIECFTLTKKLRAEQNVDPA